MFDWIDFSSKTCMNIDRHTMQTTPFIALNLRIPPSPVINDGPKHHVDPNEIYG